MDANTLSRIGLLTALLVSPSAMANDNIVVLQLGKAFSNEKLDINIANAKFHHMFWRWGDSGCQFGLGVRAGTLKVEDEETVDSIDQRNNHVKACRCGGLLNETNIYSKGKSVCF